MGDLPNWVLDLVADDPDVRVDTEAVPGRYVLCDEEMPYPVPDVCPGRGSWSTYQGRHSHWMLYETPHERVVVRLAPYPVEILP